MKHLLSGLTAALLLSFSFAAAAQQMSPAERILAMDCTKTSHPERCAMVQEAEKSCKDKATRAEQKACVREFLVAKGVVKQ